MENYKTEIFLFFFAFIAAEAAWSFFRKKKVYNGKETLANLFILAVGQAIKPLAFAWIYMVLGFFEQFAFFEIESNYMTVAAAVIFVDFLYYWQHRLMHEVKILWTMHHVHHSSMWMNFTTAFRLNWMNNIVGPFFFVPAVLIGFDINSILTFFVLNLFYQFILHTEAVGKIPFIEGFLNTPSAHRVHHGSNAIYIDKNYGGILMLWDRFFGTYEAETEKVEYGVTTGFQGHNPLKAQFHPLFDYLRGTFKREKYNVGKPEEKHSDSPNTAYASTELQEVKPEILATKY